MLHWNDASVAWGGTERGLVGRFFGAFLEPFDDLRQAGWIGNGIGMGTGAGAALMTGSPVFLLAENEWARVYSKPVHFLAFRISPIARGWRLSSPIAQPGGRSWANSCHGCLPGTRAAVWLRSRFRSQRT